MSLASDADVLREQARARAVFLLAGLSDAERLAMAYAVVAQLRLPERFAFLEASVAEITSFVRERRPAHALHADAAFGMVQSAWRRLARFIVEKHAPSVPPSSVEGDGR